MIAVYGALAEGVDPSVSVIELGTNDVGSYGSPDEYGALIDQITDMLPAFKPIVWVNTYREQYLDDTLVFNLVLEQRMTTSGAMRWSPTGTPWRRRPTRRCCKATTCTRTRTARAPSPC